ncbi:DUF945 family protein [Vibrio parahaemolyticus]|uniref:DUF945 domain-containing protein n=2 Tax=Vibrio TaxID=662 RepID=A0A0M0HUN1_9VIBR|nr:MULTISPECIES: DUF945 family protein [Vibrio]KOO05774.1 hypothetical protein AKJ31_20380 [Vibrio hepatarius]MCA2422594.1 YdgA family protein [Vibrio alginolyticus]MCA2447232.1 YdgA family protein [Vibrio alginolyticus]MCR9821517.1 YdgA family protein [Vibrio parahaemolyticus]MDF5108399.1 DUF945 family protein [Vibrio parahaemolyticus]
MKKSTTILLVGTGTALAILGAGTYGYMAINSSYESTIAKLESIDGISVESHQLSIGLTDSSAKTVIKILPNASGVLGEQLTSGEPIVLEAIHKLGYFSYPFEIKHDLQFDEHTSQLVADNLNLEIPKGEHMPIPGQIMTRHSFNGDFDVIAMTDHINYGELLTISPTRVYFTSTSDGSDAILKTSTDTIKMTSSGNTGNKMELEGINYQWRGSLTDCKTICEGSQEISLASFKQLDYNDAINLLATNLGFSSSTYIQDEKYHFSFNAIAKELENSVIQWKDVGLTTSVNDVKTSAVEEFSDELKVVMQADTPNFLASSKMEKMYARLLETGLKFNIDKMVAYTDNGNIATQLHVELPEGKMPNLMLNPLGLITVIKGDLDVQIPAAEIDKVFGIGAAQSASRTGFALLGNDGVFKTNIQVSDGEATVNGRSIPL